MIVRATSDLHLKPSNAEYIFHALKQIREDVRESGGLTLILGDLFDQPVSMHMPTYNALYDILRTWPGAGVKVIPGNHDIYDGPTGHALRSLHRGSCQVITVPSPSKVGLLVPYVEDFRREVREATWMTGARRVVWAHVGVQGAYMNRMTRDRSGLDPSSVDVELLITGHYHLPQVVGNVIYTGSPIQHSFAEEGQEKGWLRWDMEAEELPTRVAFEDTGAPRHYTVHWDPVTGEISKPEGLRSHDKVRVKTGSSRDQVKANVEQLVEAGLEGAPVLAEPRGGLAHIAASDPREAIRSYLYAVNGSDRTLPSPSEMHEWAERYQILAAVSD